MLPYIPTLIIFMISILGMIILSVLLPTIPIPCCCREKKDKKKRIVYQLDTFFLCPLIAAIIVLAMKVIPFKDSMNALWEFDSLNPIGILILFMSMVYISKFLDSTGFFQLCATWALTKAGKSARKLYFIIYAIVSILTVFTSNDVVILTFTPFIHYFTQKAKIDSTPFLFGEFFAANTWSMIFIISNPTNVVLGTGFDQNFGSFVKYMIFPTFISGILNCVLLYIYFRKEINIEFYLPQSLGDPMEHITSKLDMIIALIFMIGSVLLMALSSIPGISYEMWQVAGIMAAILLVYNIISDMRLFCFNKEKAPKEQVVLQTPAALPIKTPENVIVNHLEEKKEKDIELCNFEDKNKKDSIQVHTKESEHNVHTITEITSLSNLKELEEKEKKEREIKLVKIFSNLPYTIIPFLISLFILVNVLKVKGLFDDIGKNLNKPANKNEPCSIMLFGVLSTAFANILNNIPMSVAFVPLLEKTKNPPSIGGIYATVVGANLGANLSPLGALAGLMWLGILKNLGVKIHFTDFVKVGSLITCICLVITLLALMLIVTVM